MSDVPNEEERTRRDRSPSFPFISLPKALERVAMVANNHKRLATRVAAVGATWGYGPKSSGLLQTIAALKQYGLLEDMGSGEDRKVQLSELAWRILKDERPGAREGAMKEAALRPRLMAEYISKWLPDVPSDGHRVSELVFEKGFTDESARSFLRVFDETVSYASLSNGDTLSAIPDKTGDEELPAQKPGMLLSDVLRRAGERQLLSPADLMLPVRTSPRATLPLPEGMAALELPSKLSHRSIKALKAWIAVMIDLAQNNEDDSKAISQILDEPEQDH